MRGASRARASSSPLLLLLLLVAVAAVFLASSSAAMSAAAASAAFPGTSLRRMEMIRRRIRALEPHELSREWPEVRRTLLRAAGLRDVSDRRRVGTGYTGHCFQDSNHCDATAMLLERSDDRNTGALGVHRAIAIGNHLGDGACRRRAPELRSAVAARSPRR